jgi:uncharacterized protein
MAEQKFVRLRGHHLVCLHFFRGEGYSPDFIRNLKELMEHLHAGFQIEVTDEADDVCGLCPYLTGGKCTYDGKYSDVMIREMDACASGLFGLPPGSRTEWKFLQHRIMHVLPLWCSRYCTTCSWKPVCTVGNGETHAEQADT